MEILETQRPYEFLARWDTKTGLLKGSHIAFATVLEKDGVFLSEQINNVMPVGDATFPITDVLDLVQVDSLARIAALEILLADKEAEIATLTSNIAALVSEKQL